MVILWVLTAEYQYDGTNFDDVIGIFADLKLAKKNMRNSLDAGYQSEGNFVCFSIISYQLNNIDYSNVQFMRFDTSGNKIMERSNF